jgi:hypothetical protein
MIEQTTHCLKTLPEFFEAWLDGRKSFEIRDGSDRFFGVGDRLVLKEYTQARGFTGREVHVIVSYVTNFEQKPNYVVMACVRVPPWLGMSRGAHA